VEDTFTSNVDKALAQLIWNGIKNDAKAQALISSEKQISLGSPKNCEGDGSKKVSVFLYNIVQDSTVRNRPPAVGPSGRPCVQEFFILRYLVTPCTGNTETDHLLLGKIIQIFAQSPVFVDGQNADSEAVIRLEALSLTDLSSLWTALGSPLKPCVCYTVSPVAITCSGEVQERAKVQVSSPQTATDVNRTLELYKAVMKTFVEQSDGWKKRNLFQKQWVYQDFKKTTDMSVEEMTTTLNSLGDKLELHLATSQFIKPLNLLIVFYEHQLEQLKGFEKISKKQGENVELISVWIAEVKALVEALSS
jgi:hypothetical protein